MTGDFNLETDLHGVVEPVVLRGFLRGTAAGAWTPELLAARFPDRPVEVSHSRDGKFDLLNEREVVEGNAEMAFADFVAKLGEAKDGRVLYMQQCSLPMLFPELIAELPPVLDPALVVDANIWIGKRGALSPAHFDPMNNFFMQVAGRKKMSLFAPSDYRALYPRESASVSHMSSVDIDRPDVSRHPDFAKAVRTDIVLEAGDALILPAYYWHQVYTLEDSLSVNAWWRIRPEQALVPANEAAPPLRLLLDESREPQEGYLQYFIGGGHRSLAVTVALARVHRALSEASERFEITDTVQIDEPKALREQLESLAREPRYVAAEREKIATAIDTCEAVMAGKRPLDDLAHAAEL